jgi:hypothetical protein
MHIPCTRIYFLVAAFFAAGTALEVEGFRSGDTFFLFLCAHCLPWVYRNTVFCQCNVHTIHVLLRVSVRARMQTYKSIERMHAHMRARMQTYKSIEHMHAHMRARMQTYKSIERMHAHMRARMQTYKSIERVHTHKHTITHTQTYKTTHAHASPTFGGALADDDGLPQSSSSSTSSPSSPFYNHALASHILNTCTQ